MSFRITDASSSGQVVAQIMASRQRIATAHEHIASGKRINRPSDDPGGAGGVVRVRTSLAALSQFERNTDTAKGALLAGDSALEHYELALDRARALLTQGASDSTNANGRQAVAAEIEGLRTHSLGLANQRYNNQYIFGGTRQEAAPYDANGVPAATASARQLIQIEPDGAPVASGVTAESVFADATGSIFQAFSDAATALRGTGDPVADKATVLASLDRLSALADLTRISRTQVGASLDRVQSVSDNLGERSLALEDVAQRTEGADFAEAAIQLTESQNVLDAILQAKAATGRRSLIDLLG
jgi:flagellar hook-associated protein 3 FlgL